MGVSQAAPQARGEEVGNEAPCEACPCGMAPMRDEVAWPEPGTTTATAITADAAVDGVEELLFLGCWVAIRFARAEAVAMRFHLLSVGAE